MESLFGWKVILEIKESDITVVKRRWDRVLLSHNIIYSRLMDSSIYTYGYWDYFLLLPALHKRSRTLVLGLAGGTTPYQMNQLFGNRVRIDAVEIDRNMVRASKVFLPKRLNAKIIVGDAFSYTARSKDKYDVITLDVFRRMEVPDEFQTERFVENAHTALKKDGIMAINYLSTDFSAKEYLFKRRLGKRFKVYTIREPRLFGNKIFICSKKLGKVQIIKRLCSNFPVSSENAFIMDGYRKMY
jgi:spermidine synthase